MKVILSCYNPSMLTHGGQQVQIEQTQAALEKIGVSAEPLRWWDAQQTGDIFHHFGRFPAHLVLFAQEKRLKVVISELLGGQGVRSPARLRLEGWVRRVALRRVPKRLLANFNWETYLLADACVVCTPWEAQVLAWLFNVPPGKIHPVANGVEEEFLNSQPAERGPWLLCTATIAQVKRVVELAEAAVQAKTPLWVVGKPYRPSDPYALRFIELARTYPRVLRYEGPMQDRAKLAQVYRQARGFVLLSQWESLSLAALEAAACQCPLLLTDLPWARTVFAQKARYCPLTTSTARTAAVLRSFYDAAPNLPVPSRPLNWLEVAKQLAKIYESVLKT